MAKSKKELSKDTTKEDFTSFILGIDPPKTPERNDADTRVIDEKKEAVDPKIQNSQNENIQSQTLQVPKVELQNTKSVEIEPTKKVKLDKNSPSFEFNPSMVSVEAALRQAELLHLANKKNEEYEQKISELLKENELLASSSSVMQKKLDQMTDKFEEAKKDAKVKQEMLTEDLSSIKKDLQKAKKEKNEFERKYEEVQVLVSEKFQQSRRRERELFNRLEILSRDGDYSSSSKDEVILTLKKEMDEKVFEIEKLKDELFKIKSQLVQIKEQNLRSLKALKLAGSLLEDELNSDAIEVSPKKAG